MLFIVVHKRDIMDYRNFQLLDHELNHFAEVILIGWTDKTRQSPSFFYMGAVSPEA